MEFLKIKYRNSCDLGGSIFSSPKNPFYYPILLPVDIGRGTYELKEEGREDGEGTFIRDFGRLQRDYTFKLVVPEYTYDCLCYIQLHDTIYVTTKYDENSRVFNFKVGSPEWMKGGACEVQVSFTVDYLINSGCCNNELLTYQNCLSCSNIEVSGWLADTDYRYLHPGLDLVNCYAYYLVGHLVNGELTNNQLYQYSTASNGWISFQWKKGTVICFTQSGAYYRFWYDGVSWQEFQVIKSIANVGATVVVKGYCLPNTWVRLQISSDGITYTNTGTVTACDTFSSLGIAVSGLIAGGLYYFRFRLYDNNCVYGYSNVRTIVKT